LGIYKRRQESKKERKHAFDQEKKEKTITVKKKRLVIAPGVTFKNCGICNGTGKVSKVVNTMLWQMVSSSSCHQCNGNGQTIDNKPPGVDSTGLQFKEEIIKINIPSGVGDGMQLSMTGKGNESAGGGISGDLLILIEEKDDDDFKRDGNNVVYDLYINFTDAALGNELEVPTLTGNVKIKIPPGTQGGIFIFTFPVRVGTSSSFPRAASVKLIYRS
jgi:molecular chaperone DnaJ